MFQKKRKNRKGTGFSKYKEEPKTTEKKLQKKRRCETREERRGEGGRGVVGVETME